MKTSNHSIRLRERGIALVIILGFIVLLTGLVVAFFSRTMTDRQLSNSSFVQAKADQLALSAIDIVLGDLKQEIVVTSSATTINGVTTYRPLSNSSMLPTRDADSLKAAALKDAPNFIRSSSKVDFALQANGQQIGIGGGSLAVSSTIPSINGRTVTPARWNKHYLVPKPPAALGNDKTDPIATFADKLIPYWVQVTSQGPKAITTATPDKNVIGRYAYAIYDEGGLLDINVAGFPTGTTPDQMSYKGSLSFADLTTAFASATNAISFPQSQIDNIVGWRNYASAKATGHFPGNLSLSATDYHNAVTSNTTGFLKISGPLSANGRSDQAFLSRQQLIAFQGRTGFSVNALQYLTHFTRALNAPSWRPTQDYAPPIATNPGKYLTSGTTATALNRDLLSVRAGASVTIKHYNDDGTTRSDYQVKAGQPFLQRRFSLARLKWLTYTGLLTPAHEEAVRACFGLQWNSTLGIWTYVGSSDTTPIEIQPEIKTLDQVANENREPNFFELLQAGILEGSLGVDGGGSLRTPSMHQEKVTLQVLRIGAAIIDQYDTDSYPTVIEYNESNAGTPYWQATGIESLPFLNLFKEVAGFGAGNNLSTPALQTYLLWGLWNPQRAVAASTSVPPIRLHLKGSVVIYNQWGDPSRYSKYNGIPASKFSLDENSPVITGTSFLNPRFIQGSDFSSNLPSPWGLSPSLGGTNYFAYRLPDFILNTGTAAHTGVPTSSSLTDTWDVVRANYSYDVTDPFIVALEFQNSAGLWIAYNYNTGINDTATSLKGILHWPMAFRFDQLPSSLTLSWTNRYPQNQADWDKAWQIKLSEASVFMSGSSGTNCALTFSGANRMGFSSCNLTSDPRSLRFGQWQYDNSNCLGSLWPLGITNGYGGGHSDTNGTSTIATALYPGGIKLPGAPGKVQEVPRIFNDPTLGSKQEGAFYFPAWLARNSGPNDQASRVSGYPDRDGVQRWADSGLSGGNPFEKEEDRPVILNRAFHSVAELGYAFRDDPWRTLDFYTSNSADAALLDLFSLADEGPFSAGKINLNSRVIPCLQAALSGVMQEPVSGTALTQTDAQSLAEKLAAFTTANSGTAALLDPSQLATAFLAVTGNATPKIKTQREAVIRGLASVGQTRTWNLLVDVIAQSGRYGPTAATLDKFTVEGERRYWAHIAIDRFTGEVVDMQLEPVNE